MRRYLVTLHCVITEEMNDVKMKLKMVEEYNTSYMQQNMELEEVNWVFFSLLELVLFFCSKIMSAAVVLLTA